MILEVQQTHTRPAMTELQEIRRFTGEALRVAIPWHEHPAWTVVAERHGDEATKPPPPLSHADVRAMITGYCPLTACPRCGYVATETR